MIPNTWISPTTTHNGDFYTMDFRTALNIHAVSSISNEIRPYVLHMAYLIKK